MAEVTDSFIGDGQVNDHKIQVLVEVLAKNTIVKALYLNGNQISANGAKTLAKVIETHPKLAIVVLDQNDIKYAGGMAILNAVKKNSRIEDVSLEGMDLQKPGRAVSYGQSHVNIAWDLRRWFKKTPEEREKGVEANNKELAMRARRENPMVDNIVSAGMLAAVAGVAVWIMRRTPHDMGNRRIVWK